MRPRTTSVSLLRAGAAGAAILLALTACGGNDADTDKASTAASSSPSPSASASPEESGTAEGPYDKDTFVSAVTAAFEDHTSAHMTTEVTIGGQTLTGEGDFSFDGTASEYAMTMTGEALGGNTMDMRLVDGSVYLSMPPTTPAGKFMRIDPSDKSNPLSSMLSGVQVDPRQTFAGFEAGLRRVTFVGEEEVAGETLDHYRLAVDFKQMSKALGQDLPPAATAGIPKVIEYDLWLDDQDLMRRTVAEVMQVKTVTTTSAWGEPVTIEAPAPKDVVTAPSS